MEEELIPDESDQQIEDPDENGKGSGEDQHHTGRVDQLFARGPTDLCELTADFTGKGIDLFPHHPMALGSQLSCRKWQAWQDSNLQPPVLETGALPLELQT